MAEKEEKTFTIADIEAHNTKESLYVLLHGKVYDVTKFLDEHPGGDEVVLAEAGHDATEAFEDVGHSDEARELLPGLFIGNFVGEAKTAAEAIAGKAKAAAGAAINKPPQPSTLSWILPLGFLGAYLAYRFYFSK